MDNPVPGPLKPRLLALMSQGHAQRQAFLAQLSPLSRRRVAHPMPGRPKITSPILRPASPRPRA